MLNRKNLLIILLVISIITLVLVQPVWAGPGGKIAKFMFKTFWGRVILVILTIIFLPLIIYVLVKEKYAERRAMKDLRFMAQYSPLFDWLKIRQRVTDCFYRIHTAWRKEDMGEASEYMSHWYWQNQQLVFLDEWERKGLINHCHVKTIRHIKPLLFSHKNEDNKEHEGSFLAISIEAKMEDYLAKRKTGEIVEGEKGYNDVTTVWSFTLTDGKWLVTNIEEDALSLTYAQLVLQLPQIEETVLGRQSAGG